jgi:hypothetical protein
LGLLLAERDEPVEFGDRPGMEQHRVNEREDGDVGAEAERQANADLAQTSLDDLRERAEHADNAEGQAEQTNHPGDRLGEPRILQGQTDVVGQRRHRDARPRIECPRTARVCAGAPGVVARTSRFDVVTKYRRCGSGGT